VRNGAEGTYKARPLCIRYLFHYHGPAGPAKAVHYTGRWKHLRNRLQDGLHHWLHCTPRNRFPRARRSPWCTSRRSCGSHKCALYSPPRRVHFFTAAPNYGFRRSTINRSLGRFFRVFAPRVGNPHGVCGWFPFTRPSPPPCG